jgi:hypothetical protein
MIKSTKLKDLLNEIDTAYQQETDNNKALLWAKMAIIEVGGWTEECIDDFLNAYIDSKNPNCKNDLKKIIENNYGFDYTKNFKNICVQILGNLIFEKIENKISLDCQKLKSALSCLKSNRNQCAHTHILNHRAIDAPHVSLSQLNDIEVGLKKFVAELKKIK